MRRRCPSLESSQRARFGTSESRRDDAEARCICDELTFCLLRFSEQLGIVENDPYPNHILLMT